MALNTIPGDTIRLIAGGDRLLCVVLSSVCRVIRGYLAGVAPTFHTRCEVCDGHILCSTYDNDPGSCNFCRYNDRIDKKQCDPATCGLCELAASRGQPEVLWWLISVGHRVKNHTAVCCEAATHGNLPLLQWAYGRGYPLDARVSACAAAGGHLAVLRWIREHGGCWNNRVDEAAVDSGSIDVLQYIRDNSQKPRNFTKYTAIRIGKIPLETLKWLHRDRTPALYQSYILHAMWAGRVDILEWLRSKSTTILGLTEENLIKTVYHGRFNVIKWLHETAHLQFSPTVVAVSAAIDRLDIYEYLIDAGFHARPDVISMRIHMLLLINTCGYDPYSPDNETHIQSIPDTVIPYLLAAGYKWQTGVIERCTDVGCNELAEWLRGLGCPE